MTGIPDFDDDDDPIGALAVAQPTGLDLLWLRPTFGNFPILLICEPVVVPLFTHFQATTYGEAEKVFILVDQIARNSASSFVDETDPLICGNFDSIFDVSSAADGFLLLLLF